MSEINQEEIIKAVEHLINLKIPKKDFRTLWRQMKASPFKWWLPHHHSFGMWIRNQLRKGGFDWDSITLDDVWDGLVEQATVESLIRDDKTGRF